MDTKKYGSAYLALLFPGYHVEPGKNGFHVYPSEENTTFHVANVRANDDGEMGVSINVQMQGGETGRYANVCSFSKSRIRNMAMKNTCGAADMSLETEIERLTENYAERDMNIALGVLSRHLSGVRSQDDYAYLTVRARNFFEIAAPAAAPWTDDDEEILSGVLKDMQNLAERLVLINKARAAGVAIKTIG